jgi:hypothetical protein
MSLLLDLRACQRIRVNDPQRLAREIDVRHAMRARAPMVGQRYLSHAAGVGHFTACQAAAQRWTFFQDTERDRALVLVHLGAIGRQLQESLR